LDSKLVSGSLSVDGESERNVRSPFLTYTEQFYEVFPYYLSIGMTYEQFWDGDPNLVKYYRQAEEIRIERKNQELWLQGLYVYEAMCDVAPIMHAMAKKGTKAQPYPDQPYAITEKQRKREIEEKERKVADKGKRMMEMFMRQSNKQFEETSQET
jgi:hypothetical protein